MFIPFCFAKQQNRGCNGNRQGVNDQHFHNSNSNSDKKQFSVYTLWSKNCHPFSFHYSFYNFYPASVNACNKFNYDASGIKWRRVANVNETIEIKSLMPRGPKIVNNGIASGGLSGNTSLIASFSSYSMTCIH